MTDAHAPAVPTPIPIAVELERLYDDLLHPERAARPVSTGFDGLDLLLEGGTVPGDLVYLAANSAIGKTWFGLQVATTWAAGRRPVLYVTQEMTRRALTRRFVVQQTGVPTAALKRYDVTAAQAAQVLRLLDAWRAGPLFFTSEARSVTTIEAVLDAWPHADRPQLLVVDYLQLTSAPPEIRGFERTEYVSRTLKALAVRLGLTAFVLSSTVPPPNAAPDEDVTMYSLRGSRGISFDADVILLLKRREGAPLATLKAEKVRDGRTGSVTLRFREDVLQFEETA